MEREGTAGSAGGEAVGRIPVSVHISRTGLAERPIGRARGEAERKGDKPVSARRVRSRWGMSNGDTDFFRGRCQSGPNRVMRHRQRGGGGGRRDRRGSFVMSCICLSPKGAACSSPGRKPWVRRARGAQAPTGRHATRGREPLALDLKKRGAPPGVSCRPFGAGVSGSRKPRACALGYCMPPPWG